MSDITLAINGFVEAVRLESPLLPAPKTDSFLKSCLAGEYALRCYFATDPENVIIKNPYIGIFDLFDLPPEARLARPRPENLDSDVVWRNHRLASQHILSIQPHLRRTPGSPCVVENLTSFRRAWDVFTGGALSAVQNWDNIIVAGGSVLACLTYFSDDSPKHLNRVFQSRAYKHSDIDLFLWGMTEDEVCPVFRQRDKI